MADEPAAPLLIYVADTSALVDLRRDYPLRTFGPLWQRFAGLAAADRLVAPEEVRYELADREDELKAWAASVPRLFYPTDGPLLARLAAVLRDTPDSLQIGRLYDADPWVVALALELREAEAQKLFGQEVVILTHEAPADPRKRPHIPDVARKYQLRCVRLRHVFEAEPWEGH